MNKKRRQRKIIDKRPLPDQTIKGTMCEIKTICGLHSIFYPGALAQKALREQKYSVFHTTCECGTGYIYACQDDGYHVRRSGPPMDIAVLYEVIPWEESALRDENGVFFFKEAPSLEALKTYFDKSGATQMSGEEA